MPKRDAKRKFKETYTQPATQCFKVTNIRFLWCCLRDPVQGHDFSNCKKYIEFYSIPNLKIPYSMVKMSIFVKSKYQLFLILSIEIVYLNLAIFKM